MSGWQCPLVAPPHTYLIPPTCPYKDTWHLDTIHCHVGHVQQAAKGALHLRGGHILAFPAERVPRAVSEIQVAQLIHHQYVT